jgi:hypothetical protein
MRELRLTQSLLEAGDPSSRDLRDWLAPSQRRVLVQQWESAQKFSRHRRPIIGVSWRAIAKRRDRIERAMEHDTGWVERLAFIGDPQPEEAGAHAGLSRLFALSDQPVQQPVPRPTVASLRLAYLAAPRSSGRELHLGCNGRRARGELSSRSSHDLLRGGSGGALAPFPSAWPPPGAPCSRRFRTAWLSCDHAKWVTTGHPVSLHPVGQSL